MKLRVLLISSFISITAYAQKDKVVFSFCPLSLIDVFSYPTIQGGVELKLSKKISWYNEFGIQYLHSPIVQADTSFVHERGFKAKTEIRYYFQINMGTRKKPSYDRFYVAANCFFTSSIYNASMGYEYKRDTSQRRTDDYAVDKQVWGGNLVIGRQEFMGKRFMIDMYAGLGIRLRYVSTSHQEAVYGRDFFNTPIDYSVSAAKRLTELKGGFSPAPNLSLGVRICYRL